MFSKKDNQVRHRNGWRTGLILSNSRSGRDARRVVGTKCLQLLRTSRAGDPRCGGRGPGAPSRGSRIALPHGQARASAKGRCRRSGSRSFLERTAGRRHLDRIVTAGQMQKRASCRGPFPYQANRSVQALAFALRRRRPAAPPRAARSIRPAAGTGTAAVSKMTARSSWLRTAGSASKEMVNSSPAM